MITRYFFISAILFTAVANADDSTLNAAIGGGLGGAAGAAIGNEVGGRDGAILGGGLGAVIGAAITTDSEHHDSEPHYVSSPRRHDYYEPASEPVHRSDTFCPPGQWKKGRC
jgi:hypothetical protein